MRVAFGTSNITGLPFYSTAGSSTCCRNDARSLLQTSVKNPFLLSSQDIKRSDRGTQQQDSIRQSQRAWLSELRTLPDCHFIPLREAQHVTVISRARYYKLP